MKTNKTKAGMLAGVVLASVCSASVADRPGVSDTAAGAATAAQEVRVDITPQPLRRALTEFAQQTGVQLLFSEDEVPLEASAPRLVGTYTVQKALKELLAQTTLRAQFINARTVAIRTIEAQTSDRRSRDAGTVRMARVTPGPFESGGTVSDEARDAEASRPAASESRIEEVVVTATKRAENIQEVPLSISALAKDEIDRRGLVSSEDYLRGIPGVAQVSGAFGQTIIIRGIETSPAAQQNFASGSTVATYFGETPTTSSGGLTGGTAVDLKLVDIERVEVLRGPQGTAFGNASLGGAVRTIPVAPKLDRFEGKLGANYSQTAGEGASNRMLQAVWNIPVVEDKLAIRATAYNFEDSGYYRNVAGSDAAFQSAAALYGAQAAAANKGDVGATRFTGGRIAALFQPTADLKLSVSYLTQKTELDGQPHAGTDSLASSGTATLSAYEQALYQVAPEHSERGEKFGVIDTDIDLANATLEYQLGWANLLATFSHIESGSTVAETFFAGLPLSEHGAGKHREQSAELRLTTQLGEAWNFLGGVYAEDQDDTGFWNYYWFGDPARDIFAPGERLLGGYLDRRKLRQKAAFAEASWEFVRGLTLTGGVRAYEYDRTARVDQSGVLFSNTTTTRDVDASGTNFRANLSWQPNEAALVYAGWSQGFRLGKPQPGLPPGLCDVDGDGLVDGSTTVTIASTRLLDSDTVDSYEVGTKLTLLDRRLTLAADVYRIDWKGLPFLTNAPSVAEGGCQLTYSANAGGAVSEGVEFQANYYVTPAFRVDLGGSWVNAELTKDAPGLNAVDGDRLPGSPRVNGNLGLQYEFALAGREAFIRADSIYVGPFYGNLQQTLPTRAGDYFKLDASLRVAFSKLGLNVFVRNLTGADAYTFRSTVNAGERYGFRLRPRTIGLQLDYNF